MLCVILSLLPAAIAGCMLFGMKALILLGTTTGTAMIAEAFCRIITRKTQTVFDCSAAVTGLMLGMLLPPSFPPQWAACASAFAIIIVKQLFGGIGRNFANPALTALAVLLLFFRQNMYTWTGLKGETITGTIDILPDQDAAIWDLLLGNTAGSIGTVCAAGLLLGGLFLWFSGISSPAAPLSFLISFAALSWMGGYDVLSQLFSGSLMLCAVFAASDYTTTPVTKNGKILFGFCCGMLTFFIRHYGGYADSAVFAVLIMNLAVSLIDRICAPEPFGKVAGHTRNK